MYKLIWIKLLSSRAKAEHKKDKYFVLFTKNSWGNKFSWMFTSWIQIYNLIKYQLLFEDWISPIQDWKNQVNLKFNWDTTLKSIGGSVFRKVKSF